jgi:hypothetical protein
VLVCLQKALRKKEKKLRREREKALAAERKQKEAEEAKAREKAAAKKEKSAVDKDIPPATAPALTSKGPEALLAKGSAANGRSKKDAASGTGPDLKQGGPVEADEKKGEGSKKGVEKQSVNGLSKKRKDALALDDIRRDDRLTEPEVPILQFAKGSDGGAKSPVREKSKVGGKARAQDEKRVSASESDALNAAGFLASLVNEKKAGPGKGVNIPGKARKEEASARSEFSHQERKAGASLADNKSSVPIGVPIGPFGMPVGANMVFGAGSSDFASGFNLSANQVFPQNWQGSNMNGMAEGIKAGLSLSALLQQQLELQLQQSQPGGAQQEGVGGKRSRGGGAVPAGGKDFGLPAAAARAAGEFTIDGSGV